MSTFINRARNAVIGWEQRGRFSASLFLGDTAIGLWLLFTQRAFLGLPTPSCHTLVKFAVGSALLASLAQFHALPEQKFRWLAVKALFFASFVAALAGALHATTREALWLGTTAVILFAVFRLCLFAARSVWPGQTWEVARWIVLGLIATAVMAPLYGGGAVGSGDGHWYTLMLADFVTQLRAGVFPVWAGQTEFAFNGATYPLRYAPWFQYAGGLVDMLSARALEFTALKNATLALTMLGSAASVYVCLRFISPKRASLACVLSALWVLSPGVLAPLYSGDQYMTFMATPFIPVALCGCWVVWDRDGPWTRVVLAAGLGGLWLSHTPVALWMTFLAIATCSAKAITQRTWARDTRLALLTTAMFVALGSLPIFSTLAIDNQYQPPVDTVPDAAAKEVARCFPANFFPIDTTPNADRLITYQTGYAALGAFAIALGLLGWARPRGSIFFVIATAAIALFVLPVPWFSHAFWTHAPRWFMAANNIWPMQRLMGIWAALMLFSLAIVCSHERIAQRIWLVWTLLFALAGGGIWSVHEARKLVPNTTRQIATTKSRDISFEPGNVALTRYSWVSFSSVPSYVSHGYLEPNLEHRLLDRATLTLLTANADRAAPLIRTDTSADAMPRLVQRGVLTADQVSPDTYKLSPGLQLAPTERYALRLEFFRPGRPGILQSFDGNMQRQYMLPDSGLGLGRIGPPRSFGSSPTSAHVMPLQLQVPQPTTAQFWFIGSGAVDDHSFPTPRFEFARFWLYRYRPADLAVQVESLLPYSAFTEVAKEAWLETPRMWLRGYQATVNGQAAEVRRSPENLVMIALPAQASHVTLTYVAPWWLRAVFWIATFSWLGLLVAGSGRVLLHARKFGATA